VTLTAAPRHIHNDKTPLRRDLRKHTPPRGRDTPPPRGSSPPKAAPERPLFPCGALNRGGPHVIISYGAPQEPRAAPHTQGSLLRRGVPPIHSLSPITRVIPNPPRGRGRMPPSPENRFSQP